MSKKTLSFAKKIRLHALEMTSRGGSSHVASILSIADILSVLFKSKLKLFPTNPKSPLRDRFILSKGHAGAGVYAALAELGFFPVSELKKHYSDGSIFSGHVSHKGVPGVEFSTGSLGHGLSVACGMSYASRLNKAKYKVVNLMSDGECDEGSNWEAILFAAHHKLTNLVNIVDYNKLQSIHSIENTLGLEPFRLKWEAFGWHVIEVDGHDHSELKDAFDNSFKAKHKPTCIIAHTIKGKGVSFMENNALWHYRSPQGEEFKLAIQEINRNF